MLFTADFVLRYYVGFSQIRSHICLLNKYNTLATAIGCNTFVQATTASCREVKLQLKIIAFLGPYMKLAYSC